jgi:hypothetical protein
MNGSSGAGVCRKGRFLSFFEYFNTLREWENLADERTIKSSDLLCMVRFIGAALWSGFEHGSYFRDVD